jgi:Antitoxin SocA-like, Panacea domain
MPICTWQWTLVPRRGITAKDWRQGIIEHMFGAVTSGSCPSTQEDARYPGDVPVHATDVAAELRRHLPDLPTKKLHKLLYYCQGHHLAATGESLFSETISAWDMGPVVGTLWFAEKDRGPSPSATALTESQLNTVGTCSAGTES